MRKFGIASVIVLAGACARVMSPSGGERDTQPPRIVETDPPQSTPAPGFMNSTRPVRIVFDETLSERGPREMVSVSPETGAVDVDRDGNELRVTIDGGWQAGKVYHVTVLPGLTDRHGNARTATYELVFSTGAQIMPNVIGGIVTDRITGKPVQNARVEAISRSDSTVYTTVTDTGGFYALRALPLAVYDTRVYVDQNRNRKLDGFEARAIRDVPITSAADTIPMELALLAPDTTPARLVRAEIRDSLQVRLVFDDYVDPAQGLPPIRVTAWLLPDSTPVTGGNILSPRGFEAQRAAAADTTQSVRPDTAAVLPFNELVWVPATPLAAAARYRIIVSGYRNISGIGEGGGNVVAVAPAVRPPPPPAARDTSRTR